METNDMKEATLLLAIKDNLSNLSLGQLETLHTLLAAELNERYDMEKDYGLPPLDGE